MNATEKGIAHVIWLWNLAGCRHVLAGTAPDLPLDEDAERLQELYRAARLCGC